MMINEVCKKCLLTKKAIEYYEKQGLIAPQVLENGYRDFSREDVERLSKVAVLRRLGLSAAQIRCVLGQGSPGALSDIAEQKQWELDDLQLKQQLMRQLAKEQTWEEVRRQLDSLEKKQSILTRLLETFAGTYGQYIVFHFAPFLNDPIETPEQEQAFRTIIDFLDNIELVIPEDLAPYLAEAAGVWTGDAAKKLNESMASAIGDTEGYIAENKETIEQYLAFKQTEEFKASPTFRLQELLRELNRQNGYNEVFIPAMCALSPSYRAYHEKLLKANERFLELYPQSQS